MARWCFVSQTHPVKKLKTNRRAETKLERGATQGNELSPDRCDPSLARTGPVGVGIQIVFPCSCESKTFHGNPTFPPMFPPFIGFPGVRPNSLLQYRERIVYGINETRVDYGGLVFNIVAILP